jgi:GT2 family glycosyltransferase
MTEPNATVSCLIVTYADRRELLSAVIHRLHDMTPKIDNIVVVFNGVPYDANLFVANNSGAVPIHAVILATNTGSAEGYATALSSAFQQTTSSHFWLLDDDNQPELDALDMLWAAMHLVGQSPDVLLLSLREDRWEYLVAAHTGEHAGFRTNAFYNFHLGELLRRKLTGWQPFKLQAGVFPSHPLVQVPYAPYGGLILHRNWLDRVGFPRKDYYLYGDDHEYTDRISKAGGRIYLCTSSHVKDIDRSWFLASNAKCHFLLDPNASALRAYYGFRNRIATERQGHVSSVAIYALNATIFVTRNILTAYRFWLDKRFWQRVWLLSVAFSMGWSGRLPPMDESMKRWISSFEK